MAALGLAACTADEPSSPGPGSRSSSSPTSTASSTETGPVVPDPDRVALERAVELTSGLLAGLADARPAVDVGGRLTAVHEAHLTALQEAAGATFTPLPAAPGRPLTAARLRRRELSAQRELARLAADARSGALARVFASMSAGIAAGLAHRGEVRR